MRALIMSLVAFAWAAAPAPAQAKYQVTQKDKKFAPAKLTVEQGDSVVFFNDDAVVHNVFSETPGFEFNLKRQAPATSSGIAFRRGGVVEVRCAIHPSMKLTVTVR